MKDRVSVVVPTYNSCEYLDECVVSILSQSRLPDEIIIVDDGSSDGTDKVVSKYPSLRYVKTEHRGCAHARNTGIRESSCEYIAFLDADDIWDRSKLELHVKEVRAKQRTLLSYTYAVNFLDESLDIAPPWTAEETYGEEGYPAYIPSTLLAHRDLFIEHGVYFDESYEVGSDMDWFMRIKDMGFNELMMPVLLTRRRIHARNLGAMLEENSKAKMKIIHSSILRKNSFGK